MTDLKAGDTGVLRTEHGDVRWTVTDSYSSGVVVVAWEDQSFLNAVAPDSPFYALLVPDPPTRKDSEGRPIEEQYAYLTRDEPHHGTTLLTWTDASFERFAPYFRLLTDEQAKKMYGCTCKKDLGIQAVHSQACLHRDPSCPTHGENT